MSLSSEPLSSDNLSSEPIRAEAKAATEPTTDLTTDPKTEPTTPKLPTEPKASTTPKPTEPINPAFPTELEPVLHLTFDEKQHKVAVDTSSAGKQNNGTLGNASRTEGQIGQGVELNGNKSRVSVKDSKDINLGTHDEKTISMWFKAEDTASGEKQAIFEEGGRDRGLNMYIEDDSLIFGNNEKSTLT